jgi:gluconolactonase
VQKRDGSIWFTDPTYGIDSHYEGHAAESEIGASNVYCIEPVTREVTAVITDMVRPNGLAFSPDESLLYVADTGVSHKPDHPRQIVTYAVQPDGRSVKPHGVFATLKTGVYDGFRVDRAGNIWTSAGDGVSIYAPDGTLIGRIPVGETVSNVAFGGPKRNRLYITAQTSLYSIYVNTHPYGW